MLTRGLESIYHTVTPEGQGLSCELKIAAQERRKMFLQEIEERLMAPPPPAASRRHNGQKRKGTASAQSAILAILLIQISRCLQIENCYTALQFHKQEREIHQYLYHCTPCRLPCEPCTFESKKMELCCLVSAYKSNRLFQFCNSVVIDTCWRANPPVLTTQLLEMCDEKQVEEGHKPTAGHSYWFSDNPEWLILAWVAAGVEIRDNHTVHKKL